MVYCQYITKTNNSCKIKYKEKYQVHDLYYCKRHYDIMEKKRSKEEANKEANKEVNEEANKEANKEVNEEANKEANKEANEEESKEESKENDNEEIKLCSYIKKTNQQCTTKSKKDYILNDKFYCKKHFDIVNKKENKNESNYNKNYCDIDNCKKSGIKIYKLKNYCNLHYTKEINIEKKVILEEFKRIKNIIITENNKNIIKKDIFKLLLKIHPDKCTNPKINAHELTQDINKIFEKIR